MFSVPDGAHLEQYWLLMHGKEERPTANAVSGETLHNICCRETQALVEYKSKDPIDVIRVIGCRKWQLDLLEVAEQVTIHATHTALACDEFVEALELRQTQCGLHAGHAHIPTQTVVHETALRIETKIS